MELMYVVKLILEIFQNTCKLSCFQRNKIVTLSIKDSRFLRIEEMEFIYLV